MLPDRVSNPGPLAYQSGALPIALKAFSHFPFASPDTCNKARPKFIYLRNNFSLPVNYSLLTHVVGGQITKY